MRVFPTLLTASLASAACGLVMAGCAGGGGGGSNSGSSATTLAGALPAPQRSGTGYDYAAEGPSTAQGTVSALGVAPSATDSLAAYTPGGSMIRLSGGSISAESALPARVRGIALVGSAAWAATGDPFQAGAGEVYTRAANGTWSLAFDSPHQEAVVAALGTEVWAASGTVGLGGQVFRRAANGTFSSIGALDSAVPTAASPYLGALWIGCASSADGAPARMFRVAAAGAIESVGIPSTGAFAPGIREEVTAILPVDSAPGSGLGQLLAIAVGAFDVATGAPAAGLVLLGDGANFEVLGSWGQDAPTALAFADQTIYVGLAGGGLQSRQSDGSWLSEAIPAMDEVRCLLARDSTSLLIGGRTGGLPAVLVRTPAAAPAPPPGGGSTPPPPSGAQRYYEPDVRLILQASCVACHAPGTTPAAYAAYPLTSRLPDDQASYDATAARVNLADPAGSLLVQKALGNLGHVALIAANSTSHQTLVEWITQGARRSATASNFKTYIDDVRPILIRNQCSGCHASRPFALGGNENTNYQEVLQFTDPNNAANSELLRRNDGRASHPLMPWAGANNPDAAAIIAWINDGRRFQ